MTLLDRVSALQTLHPWLDAPTTAYLASSPLSDNQMLGAAQTLKTGVSSSWSGQTNAYTDPVLYQPRNLKTFGQQYLASTQGGNPFTSDNLSTIQKNLQAQGFGKNLTVDGAWSADWQSAFHDAGQAHYDSQLAGDKTGSASSHSLLHGLLDSLGVTGISHAIIGSIKSLPDDFRELGSSLYGAGAATVHGGQELFTHPSVLFSRKQGKADAQQFYSNEAQAQTLLGAPITPEQVQRQGFARVLNDVGTMALLVPGAGDVAGYGTKGLTALRTARTMDEAQGLGGVIRNSLLTRTPEAAIRGPRTLAGIAASQAGKRVLAGAAIGGTAGGVTSAIQGQSITGGIAQGAELGAVGGLATRLGEKAIGQDIPALGNIPVLKHPGYLIGKAAGSAGGLLDADGLYYRMRSTLAKPYEYGAVQLAGNATAKAQALSLGIHGFTWLQNTVGDDPNSTPLARYVAGDHTLDPLNDALHHVGFTLGHQRLQLDLNDLTAVLHADFNPTGEFVDRNSPSGVIARAVNAQHDKVRQALDNSGFMDRIVKGSGQSYDDLLASAGTEDRLYEWARIKTMEAAGALWGHLAISRSDPVTARNLLDDWDTHIEALRQAGREVYTNPDSMAQAVNILGKAEHQNFIETFMDNEIARNLGVGVEHGGIKNFVDAARALRTVLPKASTELLTPQTFESIPAGIAPELANDPTFMQRLRDSGFAPPETVTRPGRGPVAPGALGVMRKDRLDSQGAKDWLTKFGQTVKPDLERLDDPALDPATRQVILARLAERSARLKDFLFRQFGHDQRALAVFDSESKPGDGIKKLLSLADQSSSKLASRVYLAPNASPEVKAAFAEADRLGFKFVHGTDIGHTLRTDLGHVEVGKARAFNQRVLESAGLGMGRYAPGSIAATQRRNITQALDTLISKDRIANAPYYTAQTIFRDVTDPDLRTALDLPYAENALFNASRPLHAKTAQQMVEAGLASSKQDALDRIREELATSMGMRALRRSDVVKVLTRPAYGTEPEENIGLFSRADANRIYDTMMGAMANSRTHQVGLSHIEDLVRFSGYRLLADKGWDSTALRAVAGLPNDLANLRDRFRFSLSPLFSARRMAKTNVKMAADGIAPTLNPRQWLIDNGHWDTAHTDLDRLTGITKGKLAYLDDADRYLHNEDIFGLYRPRDYAAYYTANARQMGWDDEAVRKGLVRAFGYGSQGQEGRTAFERSLNMVFFPISFEKTVARNVGAYLMDHPAQMMTLTLGLDAYRRWSGEHANNPASEQWISAHLPILQEAQQINAFAHGLGIGEFKGINAPILNLFLPQSYGGDRSVKSVYRIVPVIKQFHDLFGQGSEQGHIVRQAMLNAQAMIEQRPSGPLNRRPSTMSKYPQLAAAFAYRNQLVDAFAQVLAWNNAHGDDNAKYHFGYSDGIPQDLQGKVISKTNLYQIVHQAYPVFDPTGGEKASIAKQNKATEFLRGYTGSQRVQYDDFYAKARTAMEHMHAGDYDPSQDVAVQQAFRAQARLLIAQDPAFKAFYNAQFAATFGPLE